MALWDDGSRKQEIANLTRALRAKPPIPARVAISTEHLLATLIAMDEKSTLDEESMQEALYCETSALHAELDALAK